MAEKRSARPSEKRSARPSEKRSARPSEKRSARSSEKRSARPSEKRIKGVFLLTLAMLFCLIGRLYYLQIICHEGLEEYAQEQYRINIIGLDNRGKILDRNQNILVGGSWKYYYVIPKENYNKNTESILKKLGAENITISSDMYRVFSSYENDMEASERLAKESKAYIFRGMSRYGVAQSCCHLIGYLNQAEQKGVSGLEKYLDKRLAPRDRELAIWGDALGNILYGVEIEDVKNYGEILDYDSSVITTIDLKIQKLCEGILCENVETSAAVIISDCFSGEILAMASYPTFKPDSLGNEINEWPKGDERLINKAIQGIYPPGSCFKLVLCAAALEAGYTMDFSLECKKTSKVEGIEVGCSTAPLDGHGLITMEEAVAYSCNCYFTQLGEMLGWDKIRRMAERLGLGSTVLNDFPEEARGKLPALNETSPSDISNLSIGQGKLLVTPLQMTKMLSIIGSEGKYVPLHLLLDSKFDGEEILSKDICQKLKYMMENVIKYGTASKSKLGKNALGKNAWGKTGTAQGFWQGMEKKHCWFIGGYDGEKTYAISIVVENGISGSTTALPIYEELIKGLENIGA